MNKIDTTEILISTLLRIYYELQYPRIPFLRDKLCEVMANAIKDHDKYFTERNMSSQDDILRSCLIRISLELLFADPDWGLIQKETNEGINSWEAYAGKKII